MTLLPLRKCAIIMYVHSANSELYLRLTPQCVMCYSKNFYFRGPSVGLVDIFLDKINLFYKNHVPPSNRCKICQYNPQNTKVMAK